MVENLPNWEEVHNGDKDEVLLHVAWSLFLRNWSLHRDFDEKTGTKTQVYDS